MRTEPKKRIDTQPAQTPLGSVPDVFGGLDLPSGPTPPVTNSQPVAVWKMGRVVLRREKAHRGGKTVIVVDDFATHLPPSVIESVARRLRAVCGCGGTIKDRCIEVQGDQPAKVRAALEAEGFQVAGVK